MSLPWRNTENAYHILLSEVMLQQTQVETVLKRFYPPFLKRFPSLQALAHASLDDVLKLWQGLGYYQRARNLHSLAKQCPHGLPHTYDELLALPGVGPNTARAIMAFAYHKPYAVMEANVKRVLCRMHALKSPKPAELFAAADAFLDKNEPFNFNQAMMDIGSQLCTPKKPKCLVCPLLTVCEGKDHPESYPLKIQKQKIPVRTKTILVHQNASKHIHAKPRDGRFLHGLYQFNEHDVNAELSIDKQLIGRVNQTYSHFKLEADVYITRNNHNIHSNQWHSLDALKMLPMSGAEKKIMRLLEAYLASPQRLE